MFEHFEYITLDELSNGKGINQIQYVFNSIISELTEYLKLQPLYEEIIIKVVGEENFIAIENESILDFGVRKTIKNKKLIILVNGEHQKFIPFIIVREAYYSFLYLEISILVKTCINQIVENDLNRLSYASEWKKFIRDSLINRDFIHAELDKLQKFFKIEAREPLESSTQFFLKEMRENISLSQNDNIDNFYDLIFENYTYKTSKSLLNPEIIETLRIIIKIFFENKLYLNMSKYQKHFKLFKEHKKFRSTLSLRKFKENLQWINKCSSIAPSYDISFSVIDVKVVIVNLKFNPVLERNKIKLLIQEWPFYTTPKFVENSFGTEISILFIIPTIYLKDLHRYFNRLQESKYIIRKELYEVLTKMSSINLNYFTDVSNTEKIIDRNSVNYKDDYEIESTIGYPKISNPLALSYFEFKILERVRYVSVTGLTFDKRIETLNAIKEDVENEIRKQITFNKEFKKSMEKLLDSSTLKNQLLDFVENNRDQGFLFSYFKISQILHYLEFLEDILEKNPIIKNSSQLQTFLNSKLDSQLIEDRLIIQNKKFNKFVFQNFISLYFRSIKFFKEELEKIRIFYSVLDACYNLKILDLNKIKLIVEKPKLFEEIHTEREKKYRDLFKSISSYKITNDKIETTIKTFLNNDPPLLNPWLINTIFTSPFAKYYPEFAIKDTSENFEMLKKFKIYFPRIFILKIFDFNTHKNLLYVATYFINIKEKKLFLTILFSHFKNSIISFKRYFWGGIDRVTKLKMKDFYDYEKQKFFYSKELFEQLLIFSKKILGKQLEWIDYPLYENSDEIFWLGKQKMDILVNKVKKRISHQKLEYNLEELEEILQFRRNLVQNLVERKNFVDNKGKYYFKRYIKSIKFIPSFQKFGFSQYYLYFKPFFYKSQTSEIDFRLLFINSFQNIKYPVSIESNPSIFCNFIFPFNTPNKSYINWLVKSKRAVSEYCLFHKKKFYDILHFNRNFTKKGWNYSSIRFKSYIQDVLFNPSYDPKISEIRKFEIIEKIEPNIYGNDTQEYDALTNIYNTQSVDIKSFLGTRNHTIINNITELLKRKLIFPYVSLKNLDFQDKISIILPDNKPEFNKKIIKIFNFFNYCRIYEIEGEFFIYGFEKERYFENGFLIEIWFPKCELDEFFNIFDLLFQYFNIKHYLILTDLVNGKTLLKSVYGNLDFLEEYNPLLNLKWNDKDKIWMNHKLFNERFEPIYPDLVNKEKN